jgi:hypothetical protein
MKVQELINILEELDPNAFLFRPGYEGGFDDINGEPVEVEMVLNYHTEWYYGSHEKIERSFDGSLEGKTVVKGYIL